MTAIPCCQKNLNYELSSSVNRVELKLEMTKFRARIMLISSAYGDLQFDQLHVQINVSLTKRLDVACIWDSRMQETTNTLLGLKTKLKRMRAQLDISK